MIHIVDDDPGVRRSLKRLLEASGFAVRSYECGNALLEDADLLPAGCALIDVRMPGMDGIEIQARLKATRTDIPVVVMTGRGDIRTAVRAMKGGAIDFIEKPFTDDLLIATIEMALVALDQNRRTDGIQQAAGRIAKLSPRERQVLDAVLEGGANKTIAVKLGLSMRTIEVHRAHMMDRLGVRRVAEAVRLAVLARLAS
jgi:two-component system response regulator FixJ